jgi:diguanylate cyclase (GGDEF)-like protein
MSLFCLDLDGFKEINDVYGHAVGDKLLKELSYRLTMAADGAYIARMGGDEFTIISTDRNQPAASKALAERLAAAVSDEFDLDGVQISVGVSIGVAVYPGDGLDVTNLIANAAAALHRAKTEDRGGVRFFELEMDRRFRERRALQRDLRAALERDELALYYQPQATIEGEIFGFEALVRWRHPVRGFVSPATFIPIAEESGLIASLGEWVLREACREAASWPKALRIAVNLSPLQFRRGDLPGLVHSVLFESGLAPGRLELEITEGVLMQDSSRSLMILRRLKSMGILIAMDDFGTGYSSMSYLQSFPFDKIKIDQSFIRQVETNPQSAAIVRAVIGLGHNLGMPVIAEGIETAEQLAFLLGAHCDEIQGYLIGRPMPIEDYSHIVGHRDRGAFAAAEVCKLKASVC